MNQVSGKRVRHVLQNLSNTEGLNKVHSNSTLKTKANIFAEGHIFKLTPPVLFECLQVAQHWKASKTAGRLNLKILLPSNKLGCFNYK